MSAEFRLSESPGATQFDPEVSENISDKQNRRET
jgi:hypothetical protein